MMKVKYTVCLVFLLCTGTLYSAHAVPGERFDLKINASTGVPELDELKASSQFNYEKFKTYGSDSYEQFLSHLYNDNTNLFKNSVVIHASGSLQPSTQEHPRVLLYDRNLVLSFRIQDANSKAIEIMEFDDKNLNVKFHEIIFNQGEKPLFVDNSPKCTVCHGSPAKPIWEAYDFWPTAMGSFSGITLSSGEKNYLTTIKNGDINDEIIHYIQGNDFKTSIDTFTAYLSQISSLIGLNKIKEDDLKKELYPYRFYFLGVVSCVDHSHESDLNKNIIYKDFLPALFEQHFTLSFDKIFDDVLTSNKLAKDHLFNLYLDSFPEGKAPNGIGLSLDRLRTMEIAISSQLEFILANYGYSLRELTVGQRKDNYILSTPNIFEFNLQKTFLYLFPEVLKQISYKAIYETLENGYYEFNCEELKQKSNEELAKINMPKTIPSFISALSVNTYESTFGKCIHCHSNLGSDDGLTPYIPFENTAKLGLMLQNGLYEKIVDRITRADEKSMPKGLPRLNQDEQNNLLQVLSQIRDTH